MIISRKLSPSNLANESRNNMNERVCCVFRCHRNVWFYAMLISCAHEIRVCHPRLASPISYGAFIVRNTICPALFFCPTPSMHFAVILSLLCDKHEFFPEPQFFIWADSRKRGTATLEARAVCAFFLSCCIDGIWDNSALDFVSPVNTANFCAQIWNPGDDEIEEFIPFQCTVAFSRFGALANGRLSLKMHFLFSWDLSQWLVKGSAGLSRAFLLTEEPGRLEVNASDLGRGSGGTDPAGNRIAVLYSSLTCSSCSDSKLRRASWSLLNENSEPTGLGGFSCRRPCNIISWRVWNKRRKGIHHAESTRYLQWLTPKHSDDERICPGMRKASGPYYPVSELALEKCC